MASSTTPLLTDASYRPTSPSSYGSNNHSPIGSNSHTPLSSRIPKIPSLPWPAAIRFPFPHRPNLRRPNLNIAISRYTPSLPFTATFHPTLYTRVSALLLLLLPALVLFTLLGPAHAPVIVFLAFALARQLFILVVHFSAKILVIRVEVLHSGLRAASDKAQEKWVKRGVAAGVDAVVLLGLLVTLALSAQGVDVGAAGCQAAEAGVILGFLGFGLLLISVPDFGNPESVTMGISIENPATGILKLATSLEFGEAEGSEVLE